MFALAIVLLGCSEIHYFDQHPHLRLLMIEIAFALIVAVPVWFILLSKRVEMIGAFVANNAYVFMLVLAVVLLGACEFRFFDQLIS
jgi:hypothetical protein